MEQGEKLLELIEKDKKYRQAYVLAYNELVLSMPGRLSWIDQRVVPRLGDVTPVGTNKRHQLVYHVAVNPKLDSTKFRRYNTVVFGPGYWCQCYMGEFGDKRRREICSHSAVVMLYQLMEKHLRTLESIANE